MIGQTLAHYEILARLGTGGMADIYRARDTRLGRELALKVLPPDLARNTERRQRFLREAKALANLKHPNIVTLYSAEEEGENLFITMELVDGRTVRDLLPREGFSLREILNIAVPLVNAVSYAHKQGILHRDLKPTNIMLDEEGRTKILDFGLVKLMEEDHELAPADVHLTAEGRVIGTPAYMSPEQAEGKAVDQRTDIFSLGIVLYEMATGKRPFKGESSASTVSSILRDDPPPVHEVNQGLPRYLGRIISRCLTKEPDQRYQTALDLQNELEDLKAEVTSATGMAAARAASLKANPLRTFRNRRQLGYAGTLLLLVIVLAIWQPWTERGASVQPRPADSSTAALQASVAKGRTMIVVLPFENLGAPEDAYFAGGVTQEINNALASVPDLGVISRTSASRYADTPKTIREIGAELGVDYVVEGSVRWQKGTDGPDRVRITPQLIRVTDDTQIWSSQYDRDLEDIFEIQSEIAQEIVDQLGSALAVGGGVRRVSGPITENLEAYQEYLKASHMWERITTGDDWDVVFEGYQRAVELDPNFIHAWTRLSMSHSRIYHNFTDRTEERLVAARAAADTIFMISPDHPMGHVALGHYFYWGRKDYEEAITELAKTGPLLDSDADVITAFAYISRRQVGKMGEAVEQLRRALPLSPRDPTLAFEIGFTLHCLRRFEEAEPMYDLAIALAPEQDSFLQSKATNMLYWTGDPGRAEAVARQAATFTDPDWNYYWSYLLAHDGKFEEALKFLGENSNDAVSAPTQYLPMDLWLGLVSWCTGNDERTRGFARSALKDIEAKIAEDPQDERYRMARAKAYALLGRNQDAMREARFSMDLIPMSKDALRAFDFKWRSAEVAAMVGEADRSLDLVEEILALPGGVSAVYLKNSPWFASLRGNERFEALIAGAS